jgi:arginyl-tRNA synthetase
MILSKYKNEFATLLASHMDLWVDEISAMIALPPEPSMWDLAFPCFSLAKSMKKAPQILAAEIAQHLSASSWWVFSTITSMGPYVNVFIDAAAYTHEVLAMSEIAPLWSVSNQKILLEYMSWNPNKPLHVWHARNVCIWDTLRRSYEALGYNIETSHYGDDSWVNVWYNIVGHLYYGYPLDSDKKFDHYCGDVYLAMRGKDEDPEFKDKLSKTLHAIEHNSDAAITQLHKDYVKRCTVEQLASCWRVWASFNMINRETDILHLDLFAEAIGILKDRGHVVFADEWDAKWCWIVDLSSIPLFQKEEKQYAILVKSDGVATYVAKDIAFAMRKLWYLSKKFYFHEFATQPDWSIVYATTSDAAAGENMQGFWDYTEAITIIDNRQIPAQTVVKSSLELLWFLHDEKKYSPLWYGVVYLTPNTLLRSWFSLSDEEKQLARLPFASRKWWTVTMDSMLDLLRQRAYEETKKRNVDTDDTQLQEVAERIAVSAFRFFLTKTDIMKDITFDIDEVLDMEWETGAYVLYTNARIKAVLSKVSQSHDIDWSVDSSLLTHPLEIALVKKIDELSGVVEEAVQTLAPHLLNRYLISASQLFNSYYNEVHISKSEWDVKAARILLLQKFWNTMEFAMNLLGMKPVERM